MARSGVFLEVCMLQWKLKLVGLLAGLALVVAACGSTSSTSTSGAEASAALTKAQYLAMLTRANARVTKVEGTAEQGLKPGATRAHVKALLLAWAHAETQLGRLFGSARAPASAASANALLASGETAFGAELAAAANHLPQKTGRSGHICSRRLDKQEGAA
jgi:hypothetical protein